MNRTYEAALDFADKYSQKIIGKTKGKLTYLIYFGERNDSNKNQSRKILKLNKKLLTMERFRYVLGLSSLDLKVD